MVQPNLLGLFPSKHFLFLSIYIFENMTDTCLCSSFLCSSLNTRMSAFSPSNERLSVSSLFNSYIIFHPLGTIKVISSSRLRRSRSGAPGLRKERALFLALSWPGNRPGSGPSRAGERALVTGGRKAAGPCLSAGHVLSAYRGWW